ncbi:MAG: hypothetical protein LC799_12685, partial [Actinobacteria bacterium]|nr:hypothetical protein [Actinomycetota bacterium]
MQRRLLRRLSGPTADADLHIRIERDTGADLRIDVGVDIEPGPERISKRRSGGSGRRGGRGGGGLASG